MTTVDPQIFDDAADRIEREGWWNGRERVGGMNGTCISNALKSGDAPQRVLIKHFGLDRLSVDFQFRELFRLNDRQPVESGQQWAVSNLREVARKLREGEL